MMWCCTRARQMGSYGSGFRCSSIRRLRHIAPSSIGSTVSRGAKELANTSPPPRSKFFVWLAFLDRCWIFARLQHHNLQNSGFCALCSQSSETMEHLLVSNVYNWEHWFKLLQSSRKRLHKELHRVFDMFVILVSSIGSAAFRGPRNSPKLHRVPAACFLCG
jgi:hypothetical protein